MRLALGSGSSARKNPASSRRLSIFHSPKLRGCNFFCPCSLRDFSCCLLKITACKVQKSVISPMNQRLLAEIGRTQRLEILNSLKRTHGMSVNELVERMGMSYMGIKQHCLTLQRDGYLDTWRRPQKMGRPEMV